MKMNPLKPVRFYGSSLPRPWIYGDGSKERVDPPTPVNDALLRWAADAHWSMGGLSNKRHRMQGKIEGRLKNLRNEADDDLCVATKKGGRKMKTYPGKGSPRISLSKVSNVEKALKKQVKGRHGRGVSESPALVSKRAVLRTPEGPWGEECGPSPTRFSPRFRSVSPNKAVTPLPGRSPLSNPASSPEFPVLRRVVERPLPDNEDSDSDVNLEEFTRSKNRPLRRSSRVTAIRRSFKEFAPSDSELD